MEAIGQLSQLVKQEFYTIQKKVYFVSSPFLVHWHTKLKILSNQKMTSYSLVSVDTFGMEDMDQSLALILGPMS